MKSLKFKKNINKIIASLLSAAMTMTMIPDILISIIISFLFVANMLEIMVCLALGIFTASSSMLVAVIEKKIKSIHLGT